MLFWTTLKLALRSLRANKLRSFLAMLGIIIGVAAVISMLALGAGAQRNVTERIQQMGSDILIVRPGQRGFRGVSVGTEETLTLADAEAVLHQVDDVAQVAPAVPGVAQAKYFNRNTRTTILGASATYFTVRGFTVARGRPFTELEAERLARVAVLGPTAAEALFAGADPLGCTIKVNGIAFEVVGLLAAKGDQGWANPDDQIAVPYTTAMKLLFGVETLREIDIQARPGADLAAVEREVTELLRRRHRIGPDADDDFHVRNMNEVLETFTSVSQTFTTLLAGIASISLLVGGIGIMNIMLVTVTERTHEIGIRKAIGARDRDILGQFLIEALVMSCTGGLIGAAAGIGIARLVTALSPFSAVIEPGSLLLALGFSGAVGIFFGYYPARRAARLDPIEALRYE